MLQLITWQKNIQQNFPTSPGLYLRARLSCPFPSHCQKQKRELIDISCRIARNDRSCKFERFLLGNEGLPGIFNFIHGCLMTASRYKGGRRLYPWRFQTRLTNTDIGRYEINIAKAQSRLPSRKPLENTAKYPICEGICALWSIDFVIQTWRLARRSNARDRTL